MDYFARIQNAIEYIEAHLEERLLITDIVKTNLFFRLSFSAAFSGNYRLFCAAVYSQPKAIRSGNPTSHNLQQYFGYFLELPI